MAKAFLAWVSDLIHQEKPDMVVNLGDTFDTHAVLRSEIVTEFNIHLFAVTWKCPYIYVLGNHDMYKPNDSKYHALQGIAGSWENLTVVDSVQDIKGITFVPYLPDPSKFPTKTQPIVIAHQTFAGCDFGGYKPEGGLDPDTISAEIIISGHIHKRQQFGKVYYPGTPYSQSLKDIDQVKGISIFDTETYNIRFIPAPFPMWKTIERSVSEVKDIGSVLNSKDKWVLKLEGPRAEIASYLSSKDWKKVQASVNVSVKPIYTDSDRVERISIKSNTMTGILEEYVDKVYSGVVSKGKIKETIRQLFDNNNKS